ncbi:MAG: hypothetical protein GY795_29325 [Desulfobacterales bacterium]|nr:hypothetical protein [Desulfobacterales bacterium]
MKEKKSIKDMLWLCDSQWAENGMAAVQIALATFGILALELALIRWTSTQIRIFAYFNNLVLIAAFLGMGLGVALGRKYPGLVHWTIPMLFVLSVPLAFSEKLKLVQMPFPDKGIFLWGADRLAESAFQNIFNLSVVVLLFIAVVAVFIFAGSVVGHLFSKLSPLRAYSADLLGSLMGIIVFTATTFFNASPPIWLFVGGLPFAWLSRKKLSLCAFAGVIVLGWFSINNAIYSPYNRIDLHKIDGGEYVLNVNRDFHQYIHNLSDSALKDKKRSRESLETSAYLRGVYDIPFRINDIRNRTLVVGAGTGNDVQAALRNGYQTVYAVEIDRNIMELGKKLHPEKPYGDSRVKLVVNDARAFFEQYKGDSFDNICYGLLDSHAMFSSMSSLRLDNYVYTEEGIRAAWKHLSKQGHLSISFSIFAGPWIMHRLYWTITKATGTEPIVVYNKMNYGATYIVGADMAELHYDRLKNYSRLYSGPNVMKTVRTTSDNWPFLYIRPSQVPWGYIIILVLVLVIAFIATPLVFGWKSITSEFDPALFFMGAAFLLIETRGITTLSLVLGSTWIVNSAIFAGILLMVLLANLCVERFGFQNPLPWFFFLLLSVVLLYFFDNSVLNKFPLLYRALAGGVINALPVGFAGIIVSIVLSRSSDPTASLGSNLLGSVIGGCLEYLSMYIGLSALVQIALILYLSALFFAMKKNRKLLISGQ